MNHSVAAAPADAREETDRCMVIFTPELLEALRALAAAKGDTDEDVVWQRISGLMQAFAKLEREDKLACLDGRIPPLPVSGLPAMNFIRMPERCVARTWLVVSLG